MRVIDEISRTLGEFLLLPNLTTETCTVDHVALTTPLVRYKLGQDPPITIAVPLVSAIMQAVSSPQLAVALARCGGLAFIHHNQPIITQAEMIGSVKRQKAGFRYSEVNVTPQTNLGELMQKLQAASQEMGVVTNDGTPGGVFLGVISTQDFHKDLHALTDTVETRMRPAGTLVTASPSISLSEANALIWEHRLEVLPIVSADGRLESIVLRRDYDLHQIFRNETVDGEKRFRVGAGINTHDYRDRVPELVAAGADVLCFDSSDGFSTWQREGLEFVNDAFPDVPVGGGNVVDARAFRYLVEAGAAFVKVGIGGGSICITREQKGIGRGQASALCDVVAERDRFLSETGHYVPICCDGGVVTDYHMAIALAFGADFLMLGRYFARFDESPSRLVQLDGKFYKEYWGEGSRRARNWARYDQSEGQLAVEEGVDGYVPYAGSLYDNVSSTLARLQATFSSCGSATVAEFHENALLIPVSHQSFLQNAHDIELRPPTHDPLTQG